MYDVSIDRTLSVYGMLGRILNSEQTSVNHRRTMNMISYEIENATLVDGIHGRVFASFQRMSRFLPQVERYTRLAATAESVYVFGIVDVKLPVIPNLRYIALPEDAQLAKEWFVILDAPDYHSVLATEEISASNSPDHQRVFKGVWTFSTEMTAILQEWLSSLVDARPLVLPVDVDAPRRELNNQTKCLNRLLKRLSAVKVQQSPLESTIAQEVTNAVENTQVQSV